MSFAVINDYEQQKKLIEPILKAQGKVLPTEGNGVVFAEINEFGEVIAFQILQRGVFFEGLWSKDKHSHLRSLWNMAFEWVGVNIGHGEVLTMTADDKIVRAAQATGWELLPWKILKRSV